jgi:hypothetical protein
MPVDWLLSSAAANEVLPEAAHGGSRLTASPFKDRTLLMSKDFVEVWRAFASTCSVVME